MGWVLAPLSNCWIIIIMLLLGGGSTQFMGFEGKGCGSGFREEDVKLGGDWAATSYFNWVLRPFVLIHVEACVIVIASLTSLCSFF